MLTNLHGSQQEQLIPQQFQLESDEDWNVWLDGVSVVFGSKDYLCAILLEGHVINISPF